MDLPVQAHGAMIPRSPWEAPVVSTFSRALNVRHPNGLLVGVVASREQMNPFSLLAPDLFRPGVAPGVRPAKGATCVRTDAGLRIDTVRLDLSSSRPWEGRLPTPLTGSLTDTVGLHARLLVALEIAGAEDGLREVVVEGASPTIFGRRAKETLDRVTLARGDGPERMHGFSGLVGLGIGFTPSGDDFLSGVWLAREMIGATSLELDAEEIRSALGTTNDGGRTLLTGVLERQFPGYLLEFASRIAAAGSERRRDSVDIQRAVTDAVESAASHGETSGTDAVTGFTWYLAMHNRRQFI